MKKLLSIILILISFNILSQTHTCTCTYIGAIEWDLAGSDITFKSKPGDTLSFVTLIDQDIGKRFEKEFWDEDRPDLINGGINKTVIKNIGKTYLIIYKIIEADGEGGLTEYKQVISFVTSP
jgi:hypothetical protein